MTWLCWIQYLYWILLYVSIHNMVHWILLVYWLFFWFCTIFWWIEFYFKSHSLFLCWIHSLHWLLKKFKKILTWYHSLIECYTNVDETDRMLTKFVTVNIMKHSAWIMMKGIQFIYDVEFKDISFSNFNLFRNTI